MMGYDHCRRSQRAMRSAKVAYGQIFACGNLCFSALARSRRVLEMRLALGGGPAQLPFRHTAVTIPLYRGDSVPDLRGLKAAAKCERLGCLCAWRLCPAIGAVS